MKDKSFWLDTAERAVKTFVQALIATLAIGIPIWEMDWIEGIGVAAGATVLSVLTSIASAGAKDKEGASLTVPRLPRA